jgi:hypothetical protein
LFSKYVKVPVGAKLKEVKETYKILGLPVLLAVWIKLIYDGTNAQQLFEIYALEKRRSRLWLFFNHNRCIHHVSDGFYGTASDKNFNVIRWKNIKVCMYKEEKFTTYTSTGSAVITKGAYLLVDGGYQKYPCFMDPMHKKYAIDEVMWIE